LEVIAVYRESIIKTYGFHQVGDVCLLEVSIHRTAMARLGRWLREEVVKYKKVHVCVVQPGDGEELTLSVCLECDDSDAFRSGLKSMLPEEAWLSSSLTPSVDLLFFHGPHFGDRYGIAEAVFTCLADGALPVLLAACAVSSIYLALPGGSCSTAMALLSKSLETPSRT
jgi:hypothetical protein